jgi:hypothetical protein
MGSRSSGALIEPRASTVNQVFKERLPFSTGSSVASSSYRFVFAFSTTLVRDFGLRHFCNQKSLAQHTDRVRCVGWPSILSKKSKNATRDRLPIVTIWRIIQLTWLVLKAPIDNSGGYVYHVLNRAVGRMRICGKMRDYEAIEEVIAEAKQRLPMRVLAWCMMPNQWQFVLWPHSDGDLSEFMRWLKLPIPSTGTPHTGRLEPVRYIKAASNRFRSRKTTISWQSCDMSNAIQCKPS